MKTKAASSPSSRRRLWVATSIIVLVGTTVPLVLPGPFLKARTELALRGIAWTAYPIVLHNACARDDTETLALLSAARVGFDQRDGKGSTGLHTAVSAGAGRAVEMLLEGGADQSLVDAKGFPPLTLALLRDDTSIARLLLARGGTPLVPLGEDRQPAPVEALATGNLNLLRLLLANDLDPGLADQQGVLLLAHAIRRADYKVIEALLEHGANASAAIEPAVPCLAHAARTGDIKLAERLLDQGADMNAADSDGISPLAPVPFMGASPV